MFFLKYVLSSIVFESEEHEKAWVIRVTINECKDLLKSFFRSRTVPLEEAPDLPAQDPAGGREVLGAVLSLPPRSDFWLPAFFLPVPAENILFLPAKVSLQ